MRNKFCSGCLWQSVKRIQRIILNSEFLIKKPGGTHESAE